MPGPPAHSWLSLICCRRRACSRPVANPNVLVVAVASAPNDLDPRVAADDVSQKAAQLIYNGLMTFDEQLRAVPDLAERLDNPEPTEYVATLRRGVRFHDGHELTSADVVYTFRSLLEPDFVTPHKGAFQLLESVDASDRYTVVFRLKEPFGSFPVALVLPQIVPDGASRSLREHPVGTGPYRFVSYAVDDRLDLAAFDDYFRGRPRNDGIVLKIVPDNIMARPRASQGHDRHRRQRPRRPTSSRSSNATRRLADDAVARRGLPVHRPQPARPGAEGRPRPPGASATRSTAGRSSTTCAAGWRFRRRASCRRSRGRSIPTRSRSRTILPGPARCSTRPATRTPTATVRRPGCT